MRHLEHLETKLLKLFQHFSNLPFHSLLFALSFTQGLSNNMTGNMHNKVEMCMRLPLLN